MIKIIIIFMSMILVNNFLLQQFLGICSFLGVSNKMDSAVGMSGAVIFVMVLAEAVTWPIQQVLNRFDIGYLQTIVFILVIASLVQFVEMFMKKYMPALQKALGIYLPLITTNCAVLGATILSISNNYTFAQSIANAAGAGFGYLVAMVMFAGVREEKLWDESGVPVAWKGIPLILVSATILSLSFMGFSGLFS